MGVGVSAEEQMDPLVNLGRRLRDETKGAGLELIRFYVTPSLDGGPHSVTGMFFLDEDDDTNELVVASESNNEEFNKMIEDQRATEQKRKEEETRQRLEQMQRKLTDPNKGIGLDDD